MLAGKRTVYKQRRRALVGDESPSLLRSDFFFPSASPFSQAAASDGEKRKRTLDTPSLLIGSSFSLRGGQRGGIGGLEVV